MELEPQELQRLIGIVKFYQMCIKRYTYLEEGFDNIIKDKLEKAYKEVKV